MKYECNVSEWKNEHFVSIRINNEYDISGQEISEFLGIKYIEYQKKLKEYGACYSVYNFKFKTYVAAQKFIDEILEPLVVMRLMSEMGDS